MPRIYRGSTNDLKLLLPICENDADVQVESVTLFAKPYTGGTVFTRNLKVDGNFVILHVPNWVFDDDEEGVINYEIEGRINGERFKVYRQSSYYLKDGKHSPGENPVPGDSVIGVLERTITENGTHVFFPYGLATDPNNPDLWDKAVINVEVSGATPNLEDVVIEPSTSDLDGIWLNVMPSEGYDGLVGVSISTNKLKDEWYEEGYNQGQNECTGGECNLEDKGVTPSMSEVDGNGLIVIEESEGFDGLDRVVIDPSTIYNEGYNKALENVDKPLVELYATENGEYLPQRTITEVLPILDMDGDDVFSLNVGCGAIEEEIEYTLKFRWKGAANDDGISNIFGSEQADWDDSAFAIREYYGAFEFKIGYFNQSFPSDNEWHTIKMGATVNNETIYIEFDGERREITGEETTFVRWSEPVYIGATNTGGKYFRNCAIDVEWIEYIGTNGKGRWTPIDGGFAVDFNGEISENTDNLAGGYAMVRNEEVVTTEDVLGFSKVVVDVQNITEERVEEWREEGRNDVRDKLQPIEITENGIYTVNDQIHIESLKYNGGYHVDTISTYDINKIEVTFKADTSASINGEGQPFILGGSLWGLDENGEDNECARAIQYAHGRIVGYWEGKWTDAVSIMDGEWLTITLDANGMNVKYPSHEVYREYTHDSGYVNSGGDIIPFIIGGQGRRRDLGDDNYTSGLIEDTQFRGLIKEVKINTNSMGEITYTPNDWGHGVWVRKVENTGESLPSLEPTEGEVTYDAEWERKYGEGWKEINVNVVSPFTTKEISYSDYQNMGKYDNNTIYLISE